MKKFFRTLISLLLGLAVIAFIGWYLFSYDRDFTRDTLLSQARFHDEHGNSQMSSWFYDMAYNFSGQDENVAIELADQYKADGNYTKAEYTLSNAINDEPSPELYIALCKTYVEQDKLLDAVSLLSNIADPEMYAILDAMRPSSPVADYEPGFYAQYISVGLSCGNGTLYCSTDGEFPSTQDHPYEGAITLSTGETTIYAISVAENGLVSPLTIMGYTVGGVIEPAVFTDYAMELAARQVLGVDQNYPLYTNDLWAIKEFSVPETAASLEDMRLIPYVTVLHIRNHQIEHLDDLVGLSKLQTLDLTGSRIDPARLSALASIPSLRELILTNCSLSDISGLSGVTTLTSLKLGKNSVRNLDALSGMYQLETLDLSQNAVVGLDALSELYNLRELDISHNSITSLAPLSTCLKLTHLEASTNLLTDVSGMDRLPLLEYLSVEYNKLTDITPLTNCTELVELSISNNQITDLSPLSKMTKLDILDFSYNMVETLPQWAAGCTLRVIDGSQNALVSIDSLADLEHISYIYMDYNQINDVNALAECFRLVQLNVYGNPVKDVDALTAHDIIVNYDPT